MSSKFLKGMSNFLKLMFFVKIGNWKIESKRQKRIENPAKNLIMEL